MQRLAQLQRPIRVLLADANSTFQAAVANYLDADANLSLISSQKTGAGTLRQAELLRPDLVLIDIALPDLNGLEVTRRIKNWREPPRVIVLALSPYGEYQEAVRNAGGDAFINKTEFYDQLRDLVHIWYANRVAPGRLPADKLPTIS